MKYRNTLKGIIKHRAFPGIIDFAVLMKGAGFKIGTDPESFARAALMVDHYKFPSIRWDTESGVVRPVYNVNKRTRRMLSKISSPQGFQWSSLFLGNMTRICNGLSVDLEKFLLGVLPHCTNVAQMQGDEQEYQKVVVTGQTGTGYQGISVNFGKRNPQAIYNEIAELASDFSTIANEVPKAFRIFQEKGVAHLFFPVWDSLAAGACVDPLEEQVGLRPSTSKVSMHFVIEKGLARTLVTAVGRFRKELESSAATKLQSTVFLFCCWLV